MLNGGDNNNASIAEFVDQALVTPRQLPWPEPIGQHAFHGLAGEVVRIIEPESEADPVALLGSFLTAFGNCVGRGAFWEIEADRHRSNVYVVLVGETAKARKGVSWGRIRRLFEKVDDNWVREHVVSGLSSGEGLIWRLRDANGDDPGVNDKRLLVQESEFASVLRRMERETNTLSAILRDAWDGNRSLATLTKNSPVNATGTHVSVVAHITTDELRRYLTRTEIANGFGNRFSFLAVRRSKQLPLGGRNIDDELAGLAERVKKAVEFAQTEQPVMFSRDGAQYWSEIYAVVTDGQPGMLGAITARAEAQIARYALLYALLDRATRIEVAHLDAAVSLWAYARDSAAFIFGNSLGDPLADRVLEALIDSGPAGLTKTELTNQFGNHRMQGQRLTAALDFLKRYKRIEERTAMTAGRPETRFKACAS